MAILPHFFVRHGLGRECWNCCIDAVRNRYSPCSIVESAGQGRCSYTVQITRHHGKHAPKGTHDDLIIQFRLIRFAISADIASAARSWYGTLAPWLTEICRIPADDSDAFIMYRISYLAGQRLDSLLPSSRNSLGKSILSKYHILLNDLAAFYATAWTTAARLKSCGETPMCAGKVGSSLLPRLQTLRANLPSAALRSIANSVAQEVSIGALDCLPTVFTHGDLLPSNILVDEKTWHMNGLVDWAESEYLPFGLSLYSLDHFLGGVVDSVSDRRCQFFYLGEATTLRRHFWERLVCIIPELAQRQLREAVELARKVGILLWHGFAWDDGKIDRVVEIGRDVTEVAFLEAFLDADKPRDMARL